MTSNPFENMPIDARSMSAQVYDAVKDAVVQGRLAPGQKVTEVQLSKQLRVSRSPLREAVRRLEAEGFIRRHGGRLFVPMLSAQELDDLHDLRAELEGLAARQAAVRATDEQIQNLREINERIARRYQETVRADDIIHAGNEFHFTLATVAANPKNFDFIRNVFEHMARYRIHSAFVPGEGFVGNHARVIDAIAARDPAGAEAAMQAHVRNVQGQIHQQLGSRLAEGRAIDGLDTDGGVRTLLVR